MAANTYVRTLKRHTSHTAIGEVYACGVDEAKRLRDNGLVEFARDYVPPGDKAGPAQGANGDVSARYDELKAASKADVLGIAAEYGLEGITSRTRKGDIILAVLKAEAAAETELKG